MSVVALLWTAPELLRTPRSVRPSEGTFASDVFSYGIIIYEICYLTHPYGEQLTVLGAPGLLSISQSMFTMSGNYTRYPISQLFPIPTR